MDKDKESKEKLENDLRFTEYLLTKKLDFKRVCLRCAAIWSSHMTTLTLHQKKRILRQVTCY